jgi:hypothetical protein
MSVVVESGYQPLGLDGHIIHPSRRPLGIHEHENLFALRETDSLIDNSKTQLHSSTKISLVDRHIDQPRELRVGVIGGGLSGVLAGILLPAKVPGIQLTVFEKNHDFVSIDELSLEVSPGV